MPHRHFTLIFLLLILCACQPNALKHADDTDKKDTKIKIPTEWIDRAYAYDYKQGNTALLRDLETYIGPDSLPGPKENEKEGGGIFNPMFADLDGEPGDELVCLCGRSQSDPVMALFKKIDGSWYLLYLERFYAFYSKPELYVANNFSRHKVFYFRWLYDRGTGIYCDAFHFYKLIGGKVYPCLALVSKAYVHGWDYNLNQDVDMKFSFESANESYTDALEVTYTYNFFPNALTDTALSYEETQDVSFVKKEQDVLYTWDSASFSYLPAPDKDPAALNAAKIACFGAFGNDSLFIKAFGHEISETLEQGTKAQKILLKKYLQAVTVKSNAADSGTQIGDLKFYGIRR